MIITIWYPLREVLRDQMNYDNYNDNDNDDKNLVPFKVVLSSSTLMKVIIVMIMKKQWK